MAGVVMLSHSSMERMKRTRPDAVDGESEPKTASWRAHHGAMTRTKTATQPTAAATEMAGVRPPADRQARQRSQAKRSPSVTSTSRPSVRASVASPASRPAPMNARPDPRSPRAASQSEPRTSGWNSEKLSGWTR